MSVQKCRGSGNRVKYADHVYSAVQVNWPGSLMTTDKRKKRSTKTISSAMLMNAYETQNPDSTKEIIIIPSLLWGVYTCWSGSSLARWYKRLGDRGAGTCGHLATCVICMQHVTAISSRTLLTCGTFPGPSFLRPRVRGRSPWMNHRYHGGTQNHAIV